MLIPWVVPERRRTRKHINRKSNRSSNCRRGCNCDKRLSRMLTPRRSMEAVAEFAASKYNFELRDYKGILDWINTYKPHPDGKLHIKDRKLWLGDE